MQSPNIVPDFTRLRVAVVGDLIADRYVYGRPTRISREAPVLVLRHEHEEVRPGGAANVARNLWELGASTRLVGALGRDAEARELIRLLEQDGIDLERIETVPERPTPRKTRLLGAEPGRTPHQVLRVDRDPSGPLPAEVGARLAEAVRALAGEVDALLVSDYGYGVVDERVAAAAIEVQSAGATVVLDPRRTVDPFRGVTAVTPNCAELALLAGLPDEPDEEHLPDAARTVLERLRPEWLLVTLGNRGMALFSEEHAGGVRVAASGSDEVIDPSGAGDTAAAAFTLSLAAGVDGAGAMRIANAASGVVVMETGTAVCSLSKLRSALPGSPHPAVAALRR